MSLRGGTIDFVGKDEIAEDRARLELPVAVAGLIGGDDRGADDVRGHEVGRELNAREVQIEHLGERADKHGFAEAGDPLEQRVPADHEAEKRLRHHLLMADDHLGDLRFDGLVARLKVSDLRFDRGGGESGHQ